MRSHRIWTRARKPARRRGRAVRKCSRRVRAPDGLGHHHPRIQADRRRIRGRGCCVDEHTWRQGGRRPAARLQTAPDVLRIPPGGCDGDIGHWAVSGGRWRTGLRGILTTGSTSGSRRNCSGVLRKIRLSKQTTIRPVATSTYQRGPALLAGGALWLPAACAPALLAALHCTAVGSCYHRRNTVATRRRLARQR